VTVDDRDSAGMRVSDAERDATVTSLRGHFETGRLTFDEFNERVDETYAARTDVELLHALRELPRQSRPTSPSKGRTAHQRRRRPMWHRWILSRFVFVNGICVSVWAASGAGYFWPVWVMIPTGAIFARRMATHAAHDRDQDRHDELSAHAPPPRLSSEQQTRRVVMSVLYVDIVGSTAHALSMGDAAWNAVLADYERRVDVVLEDLRGEKLFTKGDEVVAGFFLPASAVECGLLIRDAALALGLEVRAGVHAGEVDRIGNQANGIAMHIGRRVCEVAAPGQVLVSSTVHDLLAGSSLRFEPAGEHELKGLTGTWKLYQPAR
jgi:class 3 adenylate cyclase